MSLRSKHPVVMNRCGHRARNDGRRFGTTSIRASNIKNEWRPSNEKRDGSTKNLANTTLLHCTCCTFGYEQVMHICSPYMYLGTTGRRVEYCQLASSSPRVSSSNSSRPRNCTFVSLILDDLSEHRSPPARYRSSGA